MKLIVVDTETTGLQPELGHRIVEIAAVRIDGRRVSGDHFHRYLNPDRDSDPDALQVHGLTREFLAGHPGFAQIAESFLDFIRGSELLIHNAPFDVAFLDAELARAGLPPVATQATITDTLALARSRYPGKRNSLDALCERLSVDNRHRTRHGALLDAELLAEVYLAMTRGQDALDMGFTSGGELAATGPAVRPAALRVLQASEAEYAAHAAMLAAIDKASGGRTLWRTLATAPGFQQ
jgi:DNA polymerase-3 subunit epsilon